MTDCTSPEQSKPRDVFPPHLYGILTRPIKILYKLSKVKFLEVLRAPRDLWSTLDPKGISGLNLPWLSGYTILYGNFFFSKTIVP